MKKRVISFLLVFLLIAGTLPVLAQAAQSGRFLQGYAVDGNTLTIRSAEMASDGQFQVTLGGQALETDVSTVAESGAGVTVYCLVDVSGSMSDEQINMLRQTLFALSEQLREGDNMVISALGNNAQPSSLLQTKAERTAAIEALTKSHEDTNLYTGIVDSLKKLETDNSYHARRALVIISDGQDDQSSGSLPGEVETAVTDSDIPVYSVAVHVKYANPVYVEAAKVMGSFARASAGGIHLTPLADDLTAEETAGRIWASLMNGLQLTASLEGVNLDRANDTTLLRVVCATADASYEDTLNVYTEDIPVPETQPTETTEPGGKAEEEEINWLLIGILGGCGLLVVIIIVVLLVVMNNNKKKSQAEMEAQRLQQEEFQRQQQMQFQRQQQASQEELQRKQQELLAKQSELDQVKADAMKKPKGRCTKVTMDALRHGYYHVSFELEENVDQTLGRDSRAGVILNKEDNVLSGVHFELRWTGAKLFVRDNKSLNGTWVNGVPIKGRGWIPLENGGKLAAGSNEYRVTYTK